jgi:THO complex subunit 1
MDINASNSKLEIFLNNMKKIISYFDKNNISDDKSNAILTYPKYLTNHNLFELQLNDSSFRKTILTQFLIVLKSFLKPVSPIQKRCFVFSEADKNKIHELIININHSLPNCSKVNKVLNEEESWEDWKEKGCPTYEKHTTDELIQNLIRRENKPKYNYKVDVINNYDFSKAFDVNLGDLQKINVTLNFSESINSDNPFIGNYIERVLKDVDPSYEIEESSRICNIDQV